MWSPDRRAALAALAAVAGCGFTPVYGPGGLAEGLRGRVSVAAPTTVEGYRLRARLEERLGVPAGADLVLSVTVEIAREAVAITADGATTRFTLAGRAGWSLRRAGEDAVLASGEAQGFTGYSATGSTVATEAVEEDARERLAVILADRIVTRILAAAPGLPR